MLTIDCPKCEKLDAFEMVQWSSKKVGVTTDDITITLGWDINLQLCDCEITPEMESELNELADDQAQYSSCIESEYNH